MFRALAVLFAAMSAREDLASLRPRRAMVFSEPPAV
jgi:hypothetical protein